MIFSKGAEYGIRAMIYLAANQEDGYVRISEISEQLGISFHFLTKIFQKLTKADLLRSFRGPVGGVQLAKPASKITLEDVVRAIDGDDLFSRCILGLPGCGNYKPCPLHDAWVGQRSRIQQLLSTKSLEATSREIRTNDLRLDAGLPLHLPTVE